MTLLILCSCKKDIDLSVLIPLLIAVFGFFGNVWYQEYNKKKNIVRELSNNLIFVCDKLLRHATEFEISTLEFRFYDEFLRIKPNSPIEEKFLLHYHQKSEQDSHSYNMMRAELKKCVKDLSVYWEHHGNKCDIIEIMQKAVLIKQRNFAYDLYKKHRTITTLVAAKDKIHSKIQEDILFDGVGLHLIKIQKLIDPNSPTLYMPPHMEEKLNQRLKDYKI